MCKKLYQSWRIRDAEICICNISWNTTSIAIYVLLLTRGLIYANCSLNCRAYALKSGSRSLFKMAIRAHWPNAKLSLHSTSTEYQIGKDCLTWRHCKFALISIKELIRKHSKVPYRLNWKSKQSQSNTRIKFTKWIFYLFQTIWVKTKYKRKGKIMWLICSNNEYCTRLVIRFLFFYFKFCFK